VKGSHAPVRVNDRLERILHEFPALDPPDSVTDRVSLPL
jgi:hypothetical protein